MKVPFLNLTKQYQGLCKKINPALGAVFTRGDFILGKEVRAFEQEFAAYCGCKYAVGVNSGTDALFFALLAAEVGKGDEVICPVFTYIATAFAITYIGAKPIFADIDPKTYNIDVRKIEKHITSKTKAIIPVHLYGQPADMAPILKLARRYKLKVIEDAAQAHGAVYKYQVSSIKYQEKKTGAMGDVGCFSFYPTKNLGAYGDGGMVTTNEKKIYERVVKLRDYGRIDRYTHESLGYNSRLDTVQAAILRVKLPYLDQWNEARRQKAKLYYKYLREAKGIILLSEAQTNKHVYHVFAIRVKNRAKIIEMLSKNNVDVLVHYPLPLHLQPIYKSLGYKQGDFPVAELVANEVLSLPIYPELTEKQIRFVCSVIRKVS